MAKNNQAKPANQAKADEEAKAKVNVIAKGKAITCKRGIKSEGQEICADDFVGGAEVLKDWIEKGFIV